ncbi:acetyl-CoA synthetase-like protein [Clathrospora elynae]|uniref:Acetyl-CoA synthetase-like protein n=1 Tax=Clathrospora elynae TaxID=706981 RepID=A0A6A5S9T6_9PLEO|nr:acetyl-CoA synthetase-like protein [Clathrospora elynae]
MDANWAFLTQPVVRLLDPHNVPSLRTLIIGGEEVSSAACKIWTGKVEVVNAYGLTKCCVFCTAYFDVQAFTSWLTGKAVASVSWVVDPENYNHLAPLGLTGELLVEGPILARDYLNDFEKTKAAFIDNPMGPVAT